jgi:nucleoside-diphosphate-sugar epimerase
MTDIIQALAGIKLNRNYQLDKPKGVRGRSSDNTLAKKILDWSYNISLNDGLKNTYDWIYKMLLNKESAKEKFIKSSI